MLKPTIANLRQTTSNVVATGRDSSADLAVSLSGTGVAERAFVGVETGTQHQGMTSALTTQTPVVEGFGTIGQYVASELSRAIQDFNKVSGSAIFVTWQPNDKCFVLKNSSGADKTAMQRVTENVKSDGWVPVLADKTNSSGDFIVRLKEGRYSQLENKNVAYHYEMTRHSLRPQVAVGSAVQKALMAPAINFPKTAGLRMSMHADMQISPAIAMGVFQGEAAFANPKAAFINPGIARSVLQGEAGFTSADSENTLSAPTEQGLASSLLFIIPLANELHWLT